MGASQKNENDEGHSLGTVDNTILQNNLGGNHKPLDKNSLNQLTSDTK